MSGFGRSPLLAVLCDPRRFLALDPLAQGLAFQRARRLALAGRLAAGLAAVADEGDPAPPLRAAVAGALRSQRYREGLIRRELDILARDFLPRFDAPVVALKGAAYLIRGLDAALGRIAADVDLLVRERDVDRAAALLGSLGYTVAEEKDNPYDRRYYRVFMHEVAPMRHDERGVELDLHFRLLPRTHRLAFPMDAVWERIRPAGTGGYFVLDDADLFIHAAIHFLIDGEGREATRRMLELHDLLRLWPDPAAARAAVLPRASELGLLRPLEAAFLLLDELDDALAGRRPGMRPGPLRLARRALWRVQEEEEGGRPAALARFALWMRGHLLRMPLPLLARHLVTKWWRRRRGE